MVIIQSGMERRHFPHSFYETFEFNIGPVSIKNKTFLNRIWIYITFLGIMGNYNRENSDPRDYGKKCYRKTATFYETRMWEIVIQLEENQKTLPTNKLTGLL